MSPRTPITPKDILDGLADNMSSNAKPVRKNLVYVPSRFVIRYSDADRDEIEDLRHIILGEAGPVLGDKLAALNDGGILGRLPKIPLMGRTRYVPASVEWTVELLAAPDDMVEPGTIRIQSRMSSNDGTTLDGTETVIATRKAPRPAAPSPAPIGFAKLRVTDNSGTNDHVMTKQEIAIGRGGPAHWADIQIAAGVEVSREHCRIRALGKGTLEIQDKSANSTKVNGRDCPKQRWQALPTLPAKIELAPGILVEVLP